MEMDLRVFSRGTLVVAFGALVVALSARAIASQGTKPAAAKDKDQKPAVTASADLVARGEYLTTSVAMCVQCHSGRDEEGNILDSQRFHGGAIPVTSPFPYTSWAAQAPNLAGLPGFTDEQVISLLTTGNMGDGRPSPRRPMPPFRMSKADAEAIVAFLRSR
jgi:mono/diheme cytochrome c family protein